MSMTRIELCRDVADNGYRKIRIDGRKILLDAYTASAVVAVHDALNEKNRAHLLGLPWNAMVEIVFKLLKKFG
jgi:hypothetical protein